MSVERNSSKGDMSLKYVDQTLSASGEILLFPLDLLLGLKTSRHNPHVFWRSHRQKKSLGKAVVQFPCKTVKRLKTTEATPKKGFFLQSVGGIWVPWSHCMSRISLTACPDTTLPPCAELLGTSLLLRKPTAALGCLGGYCIFSIGLKA